jgi:uncharacterized repeat protein (TIGR01451 family)
MTTSTTLTDFTITQNGGTLNVVNSVFTNNRATQNGGAIANDATFTMTSSSTITRTIITKNGGTATISGSTFIGNKANNGGAISNLANLGINNAATLTGPATALNSGTVTVTNSVIMGNTANNNGGAIYNSARTLVSSSTFTNYIIDNVATITARFNTLAGNSALRGGAVYNDATSVVTTSTLTTSTLNNVATATTTDNALVNNHASTGRDIVNNRVLTQNGNTPPNPILSSTATVDAMRNWWGSVTGPLPGDVVGTVDTSNFLIYAMNIVTTASNTHPNVGQQFHYTIIVTNNGPDGATDVQVTDGIPDGLTFNGSTASQGTYNHATEIWNVGSLASGASAVLQLFVSPTSSVAGTLVTKAATLINTNDTSSATVTVAGTPVPVILTKTASNLSPNVGQQFNYILTVINHGASSATGVQVTDVLPAGFTFNSYTASQGTYNSGTGLWNVGTLLSGAGAILHLFVTPTAITAGTTVANTATTPGQTAIATVAIPTTAVPVVLSKTASNLMPNFGQLFSYIITATNNGPGTATGVIVRDKLPAGLTFNGYTASQGTYNSATGIWTVGTLTDGASAVLRLFATPTLSAVGTTVTNTATTTGQTLNAVVIVPANNIVNVVLTKTASTTTPRVGNQFHYTITATNHGPGTATGVQVTDILPAGLIFNSFTASQGTYNSATGIWNIGTLLNSASVTLRLFVTPTNAVVGESLTNVARITAINEFNINTSPFASQTVTVLRSNGGNNNVNAETETIPMQKTGIPIAGLIAAILMVLGGTTIRKLQK